MTTVAIKYLKEKFPPRIQYSSEKNTLMMIDYQKEITGLSTCEDLTGNLRSMLANIKFCHRETTTEHPPICA